MSLLELLSKPHSRSELRPLGSGLPSYPWHYLICHWDSHDEAIQALVPSEAVRRTINTIETGELPDYARGLASEGKNAFDNDEPRTDLAGVLLIDRDRTQ